MNDNRFYGTPRDELIRMLIRLERRRDGLKAALEQILDTSEENDVLAIAERTLNEPAYVVEENRIVPGGTVEVTPVGVLRHIDARSAYPRVPRWRYGTGGALLADEPFVVVLRGDQQTNLTTEIPDEETRASYGARFMIAESMSLETARAIAAAFGAELEVEGSDS